MWLLNTFRYLTVKEWHMALFYEEVTSCSVLCATRYQESTNWFISTLVISFFSKEMFTFVISISNVQQWTVQRWSHFCISSAYGVEFPHKFDSESAFILGVLKPPCKDSVLLGLNQTKTCAGTQEGCPNVTNSLYSPYNILISNASLTLSRFLWHTLLYNLLFYSLFYSLLMPSSFFNRMCYIFK